jgi:hypothetical protein
MKSLTRYHLPLLFLTLLLSPAAIADQSPNTAQTHHEQIRYLPQIELVGDAQGPRADGAMAGSEAIDMEFQHIAISGAGPIQAYQNNAGWDKNWTPEGKPTGPTNAPSANLEALRFQNPPPNLWIRLHVGDEGWTRPHLVEPNKPYGNKALAEGKEKGNGHDIQAIQLCIAPDESAAATIFAAGEDAWKATLPNDIVFRKGVQELRRVHKWTLHDVEKEIETVTHINPAAIEAAYNAG